MDCNYYTAVKLSNQLVLNKPIRVIYKNKPVVIFRTENSINAYEDFCPHRGLALSEGFIENNQIHCKYHGWSFNCKDGKNTLVPVKNSSLSYCKLKPFLVQEKYNIIWLSDIANAIIPELQNSNPTIIEVGEIQAQRINILENFLEGSHTHFVHDGLIRSRNKKRNEINAQLISNESGFKVFYESEPAKGFATKILPKKYQNLRSVSTYIHPNIAILEYFNEKEQTISRFEAILIEENNEVKYMARIFINIGFWTPLIRFFAKRMFAKIIDQDKDILESQEQNLSYFKERKFITDDTDLVGKYLFYWHNAQNENLDKKVDFKVFW